MPHCLPTQTITDRFDIIQKYIAQGDILDLGIVDAWSTKQNRDPSKRLPLLLFRKITELNPNTIGVDLDEQGINSLKEHGYNVICADAQTMNLQKQFDTIIAGEIIEHVENAGQFLRTLRNHLKPNGHLIVSTPNPFYAKQSGKIWRHGKPQIHDDHTCWFDPITLDQLMRRVNLKPVECFWVQPRKEPFKVWARFFRKYFSHSFMTIATLGSDPAE